MIVDVHTHLWNQPQQLGPGTLARLQNRPDAQWDQRDSSPTAYDDAMEPVDCAFILGFESRHMDASIPIDQVAGYARRRPDKYVGFAGIDPLIDGFLDRVDQAVEQKLAGVTISPAAQACHPTHSNTMKLYEKCQTLGLPVMVHPGTHMAASAMMEFSRPHLFDEVGRTFPDLHVILAQVGHPWVDEALLLVGKHPNFYADLSDVSSRPWQLYNTLLLAYQQGVTEHLLIGSDFPFSTPQETVVNVYSVNQQTHGTSLTTIPRATLQAIVERDVLSCLGIADKVSITPQAASDDDDAESESEPSAA